MAQKKGQTGNPRGRPKGTPNKITTNLRQWVNDLLNDNRQTFEGDLKQLEPHQRVAIFEKMLSYALPKLQSVEAQIERLNNFDNLTNEQLDIIINQLTNSIKNEKI